MKLYYHPRSPNSIPVLAVAYHLGIDLDLREVNLHRTVGVVEEIATVLRRSLEGDA